MRVLSGWLLRAHRWGRTAVESVRSETEGRRMTDQDASLSAAVAGTFSLGGDLFVNRLGFGAMRLTGRGILGEPEDPEEARRVLRRAVELGVNLIDTADSYGPEVSERLIAEALHPYPEGLVIATKAGLTRQGPGIWTPVGRPARRLQGPAGRGQGPPHRCLRGLRGRAGAGPRDRRHRQRAEPLQPDQPAVAGRPRLLDRARDR